MSTGSASPSLAVVPIHNPGGTESFSAGFLVPHTLPEAMEIAKVLAQSDYLPGDYRGKPANVVVAMQLGAEVGLSALQSVQNICVINGHPQLYGDALIALVQGSPLCELYEDGFDDSGQYGWARTKRKGRKVSEQVFSMAMAKKAGLLGKKGPWQLYPERMCKMRARSWLCRDTYPDVLKGLSRLQVIERDMVKDIQAEVLPDGPSPGEQPSRVVSPAPVEVAVETATTATEPDENYQLVVKLILGSLAEAKTPDELRAIREEIQNLPADIQQQAGLVDAWNTRKRQLESDPPVEG